MEPKLLSEAELAAILERAQREFDDTGAATSQLVDVEALIGHIDAREAQHQRDLDALAGDSIRQGEATARFEDAKDKRIAELSVALEQIARFVPRDGVSCCSDLDEVQAIARKAPIQKAGVQ